MLNAVENMEERNLICVAFVDSREINEDEMDEDEDIDQDDEDFDFSADSLKIQLPRKQIVKMMLTETKQIVEVKCRLLWTWKWMQAVIELWDPKIHAAQQLINGTFNVIEYRLNPSSGAQAVSSISLFLADLMSKKRRTSAVDDNSEEESLDNELQCFNQYKADFCNWIKSTVCKANNSTVKLECLDDLLQKYLEEQPGHRNASVQMFREKIKTKHAGHVLSLAVQRPTFFKASMILFPKKMLSMLPDESDDPVKTQKKEVLLDTLEKTTIEAPWAMGFSDIMYKATKFSGLEAPYSAMSKTWFFPLLSNLHKNSLQIYDVFKTTCKEMGHTYLKANDLLMHLSFHNRNRQRIKKTSPSIKMTDDSSYKAVDFHTEQEVLRRQVKGSEERFHLMRYWRAEEEICRNFATILLSPPWDLGVDLSLPEFSRLHDDEEQMKAASSIVKQHITMISGRGGTGKTEVVSAVLKAAEVGMNSVDGGIKSDLNNSLITEDGVNSDDSIMTKDLSPIKTEVAEDEHFLETGNGDWCNKSNLSQSGGSANGPILYCAPTGKAASVIKKRVGKKAFTIHQILASYKLWKSGDMASPWKFSTTRVVAVDECSMVSIEIFSLLIKYLKAGSRLQKIVLLGDHLQLPSVDPGNFMEDLYKAMIAKGFVVNLKTNHRSEGSLIFNNATKISQQQMPIFDDQGCFRLLVPMSANLNEMSLNAKTNCRKLENDLAKPMAVVAGKKQNKQMPEDKEELYWSLLRKHKEEYKIENDETSQMIAFLNRECNTLNQYGCFVYNNHLIWTTEGRRTKKQFLIGDKVMCTKNADIPIYVSVDEDNESDKSSNKDGDTKEKYCSLSQVVSEENDGVYREPGDLKLKTKNERLMNGSVFKIRATCKTQVEKADPEENSQTPGVNTGGDVLTPEQNKEKRKTFATYYVLDDMMGNIVRANQDQIHKKCNLSHAWALSIHKFQGSEADTIVYGVSGSGYENWRHVYTAVTRGKKNVVIVGQYEDLKKAVNKRPIPRQTALSEKTRKMIVDVNKEIEDKNKAAEENEKEIQKVMESMAAEEEDDECEVFSASDSEEEVSDVKPLGSPMKRKTDLRMARPPDTSVTPPKRLNVEIASEMCNWNVPVQPFLSRLKRPAESSPCSYKSKCEIDSPNTYSHHRENPACNALDNDDDDSFNNLDLTGIEEDAIIASQSQSIVSPLHEGILDAKQPCTFGRNCIERTIDHLKVFRHPTDAIEQSQMTVHPSVSLSPVTKCLENSLTLGHVKDASKRLFDEDFETEFDEREETLDESDEDIRRAMAMSILEQTRQQVEEREFEEAISNSQIQR